MTFKAGQHKRETTAIEKNFMQNPMKANIKISENFDIKHM